MKNILITLALLGILPSLPVRASTFDPANDFSTSVNSEISVWSYRYKPGTARDGNYPLLPAYGPADGPWSPINPGAWTLGGGVPEVGLNQTGSDVSYITGFIWPNDGMLVHPGNIDLVIVSWLSPSTTIVDINFSFSDLDPNGGNGIAWFVEKNNSAFTLISGAYPNGGTSGPQSLTCVPVSAGDRINFIVDPKNGDYGYDSTVVAANIVPVALGISAVDYSPNGRFRFTADGPVGQVLVIEASPDLRTWTPLQTNTLGAGPLFFSDPESALFPRRFYRLKSGP